MHLSISTTVLFLIPAVLASPLGEPNALQGLFTEDLAPCVYPAQLARFIGSLLGVKISACGQPPALSRVTHYTTVRVARPASQMPAPQTQSRESYTLRPTSYPNSTASTRPTGTTGGLGPMLTPAPTFSTLTSPDGPSSTRFNLYLFNYAGADMQLDFASNVGLKPPLTGSHGTLSHGTHTHLAFPTGWAGNVALNQKGRYNVNATLIEGSFVSGNPRIAPMKDIDISYVNGYSAPVACYCRDRMITGCLENLWAHGNCTTLSPHGDAVCGNDARVSTQKYAEPFFEACAGQAYTYPDDWRANSNGQCEGHDIVCCIDGIHNAVGQNECPVGPEKRHRERVDTAGHWMFDSRMWKAYREAVRREGRKIE